MTTEDIEALALPQALSLLQKEFLYWHNIMYHIPNHRLIQPSKYCVILHRIAALKDKPPIGASYHFGRSHNQPWQKKVKHTNHIQSKDYVNPGDYVSTYPIVSTKTGLVPQISGYLTRTEFGLLTYLRTMQLTTPMAI